MPHTQYCDQASKVMTYAARYNRKQKMRETAKTLNSQHNSDASV
jgi:hypothetical protein